MTTLKLNYDLMEKYGLYRWHSGGGYSHLHMTFMQNVNYLAH